MQERLRWKSSFFQNFHSFVKICLKFVAMKTQFYCKRGYIKIRKPGETFHGNKATNWLLLFSYQLRCFQSRNLWYTSQTLFAPKRGLAQPFFIWKWITSALSLIWLEINDYVFSSWGSLFAMSLFFGIHLILAFGS